MAIRLRSLLHVPAAHPLPPAGATAADAIVIDLTGDAHTHPDECRARARAAITALAGSLPVFVRVGGVESARLAADLAAVLPARPFGVMLSEVAGAADVEHLGARLRVSEAELGRADGETRIIPVIGAPAGVLALAAGDWPAARLAACAWELPFPPAPAGDVARLVRSLTILAAARAAVPALDPPLDAATDDTFRRACIAAAGEGIGGRIVRGEAQAAIANAVFAG